MIIRSDLYFGLCKLFRNAVHIMSSCSARKEWGLVFSYSLYYYMTNSYGRGFKKFGWLINPIQPINPIQLTGCPSGTFSYNASHENKIMRLKQCDP